MDTLCNCRRRLRVCSGGRGLNVTFYGVRGSTPCSSQDNLRYGGNTSCVALEVPGQAPIVLDLGTGLRFFGLHQPHDGSFRCTALASHLHWDHVQGLPFLSPLHEDGSVLDVYAPVQDDGRSIAEVMDQFMCPPYFPVRPDDLIGTTNFFEAQGTFSVGLATVTALQVPHVGPTNGYRVDWNGFSVAYLPDHQQPLDGSFDVSSAAMELCRDVDLLIHDAQFDDEEWARRPHWGHCTIDYALHVAHLSGAKRLALFHHDPAHHDEWMDKIVEGARSTAAELGIGEVFAAMEGLSVSFLPAHVPSSPPVPGLPGLGPRVPDGPPFAGS